MLNNNRDVVLKRYKRNSKGEKGGERRLHESLDNLTPKDVYLGQGEKIKKIREIIKQNSINKRIFDNKTRKYQSK